MEKLLFTLLPNLTSNSNPNRRLRALTTARSLLINPNSSDSTRRAVIDSLIQSLDHHRDDLTFIRFVIKVLGDASVIHRHLASTVVEIARSLLKNGGDRLAADALAVLSSLGGSCAVLDEDLALSLASSSIVSVRLQIVDFLGLIVGGAQNSLILRPDSIARVLLALSADLYPSLRSASIDGLVKLLRKDGVCIDRLMVECCYNRAVVLLRDEDELVRSAAVQLVSECGQVFAATEQRTDSSKVMDVIFLQLCSLARDMSLKVRRESFIALGKVRLVSESVLLQSLFKKVLASLGRGKSLAECIGESKFPLSSAAGAFVHGIEDEFYEVRMVACKSLGMLSMCSIQFAGDALSLLMDMLNDDTTAVRLQTLQTLFDMATHDRLWVQERHMHMFLGMLYDNSALIRWSARKLLRVLKLSELEMFISSVNGLIANLETFPEEEEDIFFVLFFLGKNHGKFAIKMVKEFELEIVPSCKGELSLDSPRAAALLVLVVSSSFSNDQIMCDIPGAVFSYAVPLLGRICRSLEKVIPQDLLLAYLCHRSGMPVSAAVSESKEVGLPHIVELISDYTNHADPIGSSLWPIHTETLEINSVEKMLDVSEVSTSIQQAQQRRKYLDEEITQQIQLILKTVTETWPLIKSQSTHSAQRILRACKEELEMIAWDADGSISDKLAFASCYVQVIQLFADIWEQLQPKKFGMIALDFLLEKIEFCLKGMRYRFSGFSRDEEWHILQITLCSCVLRLYRVGICSSTMLQKLQSVIRRLEELSEGCPLVVSDFAKTVKEFCTEVTRSEVHQPFPFHKLLQLFCLEQIQLSGKFRQIKAELSTSGGDSENPLPFVSGLPVGITFQITVYNILRKETLWLRMAVGKSIQYVFLDVCQFEGSAEVRKCTINVPYYATPKAASFLLRACICMECPLEDATPLKKGQGGPEHDIALLSTENSVYLVHKENICYV